MTTVPPGPSAPAGRGVISTPLLRRIPFPEKLYFRTSEKFAPKNKLSKVVSAAKSLKLVRRSRTVAGKLIPSPCTGARLLLQLVEDVQRLFMSPPSHVRVTPVE